MSDRATSRSSPEAHTRWSRTYPLGKRPRGIKASPDGTRLFVALSGSPPAPPGVDESTLPPPDRAADGVGVVDVETGEVVTVLRGGTDPEQVAVNPDGTRLYVANEDAATASVLDIETGEVLASLDVGGEPEGVSSSPDGRFVYVTSEEDNQVSVIDVATNTVIETFEVGPRPRASAFSPDSSRAFVTSENGGTVSIVDTSEHEVIATLDVPGDPSRPMGVVVSADGGVVYVSTGRGQTVVAMNAIRGGVIGSVTVGTRPWGYCAQSRRLAALQCQRPIERRVRHRDEDDDCRRHNPSRREPLGHRGG